MADALISPAVGGVMFAASTGTLVYSVNKVKDGLEDKKIPLMGVMGAFVFSAQMINFTIPATGSSGHIGGGILLAALLGPYAGFLVITSVLLIQALFFGDGGLLALGCNIFNMGFLTCFIAYPLLYKPILKKGINPKSITIATILAVVMGLQLGAFGVVIETLASGRTELPFATFALLMQPIHLAIGLFEGIIVSAVLCFIYKFSPDLLQNVFDGAKLGKISIKSTTIALLVLALITGGFLSWFASENPDGLEWAITNVTGSPELASQYNLHSIMGSIQEKLAFLPDYNFKNSTDIIPVQAGTTTAGLLGGFMTLGLAGLIGFIITRFKK
jgi:cobalt/nickel transport system permease protein